MGFRDYVLRQTNQKAAVTSKNDSEFVVANISCICDKIASLCSSATLISHSCTSKQLNIEDLNNNLIPSTLTKLCSSITSQMHSNSNSKSLSAFDQDIKQLLKTNSVFAQQAEN